MANETQVSNTLFHFLTTDTQSVGILSWVSFLVTFGGFVITIWQIRKTKSAAQAASLAAAGLASNVKNNERLVELGNAASHLNSAVTALTQRRLEASAIYIELATTSIFQVDALLAEFPAPQAAIKKVVIRVKALGEKLSDPQPENSPNHLALAFEARQITIEVKSIAASVRYAYNQEAKP